MLGNTIANYRRKLGLTQEQLAQRLEVTNQAVSKWETDQCCPDVALLPVLADVFGISMDALFGRESTTPERRDLPWEDDDALHIVVYAGHTMIGASARENEDCAFYFEGPARDIHCNCSVSCGDVSGNVTAAVSVECGDVGGNVEAGGYVECGDAGGNVEAGGYVECGDVGGNVEAGGYVECGNVAGHLNAGHYVECGDVDGNLSGGSYVECGDVGGSVNAQGYVECGDVGGNVTAEGYVECGTIDGNGKDDDNDPGFTFHFIKK